MINQYTKETILTSIQQTEDDEFNIFGIQVSSSKDFSSRSMIDRNRII